MVVGGKIRTKFQVWYVKLKPVVSHVNLKNKEIQCLKHGLFCIVFHILVFSVTHIVLMAVCFSFFTHLCPVQAFYSSLWPDRISDSVTLKH